LKLYEIFTAIDGLLVEFSYRTVSTTNERFQLLITYRQAIDRVHRLGQEREVFVKHYIVAHTVEKRVLAIQKRKTAIVLSALGKTSPSTSEGLENLRIMFGDDEDDEF
jgi:hypothetical protein